jgi:hypothetical protein
MSTFLYHERNAQADQGSVPTFIPTVFVGLGGSGKSVLMRLRKQFHDRYANWGSKFDRFARFVFVDTDQSEFVPKGDKNKMFADVLPDASEIVQSTIARDRFTEIFDDLERQRDSKHLHWLMPSMRSVGYNAVEDGAGQFRQFGRLAFFVNYQAIRQQIKTQIEEVLAYSSRNAAEVMTGRIEVVIVTSLAGGTGSGMFLDVAYLVRDLLSHSDYKEVGIKHVTLVAFLPEIFRSTPAGGAELMPRLRQNGYAALLEMEHYGTPRTGDALYIGEESQTDPEKRHGFRATWPGRGEVLFPDRGWDTLFLVDNVNNLTKADPLKDTEVFQMTADYLFLDFGHSKFATGKRSARSNLVQYKDRLKATWIERLPDPAAPQNNPTANDNIFATQSGCIYSSFGLAEVFFDIDNLYQAAGYRLASQLVKHRWIGPPAGLTTETYQEWAKSDLLNPLLADAPKSFLSDKITRQSVVWKDKDLEQDWIETLNDELESVGGFKDEEEAAATLDGIIEKHRDLLGRGGEARKTIGRNVALWTGTTKIPGPWRLRLQSLSEKHLSEYGIEATKQLLVQYRWTLQNVLEDLHKTEPGNLTSSLLSRLEEATKVPFPVRQIALQIELARARVEAEIELKKQYKAIAKIDVRPALQSAIDYIGEPGKSESGKVSEDEHGTLQGRMDRYTQPLRAIAYRLNDRFGVASAGRDLVNHRKQSLTVVWDERRYDEKINETLQLFEPVGRDPLKPKGAGDKDDPDKFEFVIDWAKLDELVRAEFKEVVRRSRDLQRTEDQAIPADSLADLLRYWVKNEMTNDDHIVKIAQWLAEACQSVLRSAGLRLADVQNGNVADLLINVKNDTQRRQMIEQMVVSAAPYLPTQILPNDNIQAANHNLFGLSVGGKETSEENVERITEIVATTAATRQPGGVANFGQRLETEQSSALFVRMMAGFPLQAYSRLNDLYDAYRDPNTNTRTQNECHIDYKQSWEDLPDIRPISSETYDQIRKNIDLFLLNMMIGAISYPKDKEAFYVLIPDRYIGAGEDKICLGKQISRAIKRACDDPAIRHNMRERWDQWSANPSVKAWACMYESALRTLNETRFEITVEAGRNQSVPFRNCYGGLIRMIGNKLGAIEGGRAWLDALKPESSTNYGEDEVRIKRRPTGLDSALKRINEHLKIYQIIHSKVESVALPEPDAVAPSA